MVKLSRTIGTLCRALRGAPTWASIKPPLRETADGAPAFATSPTATARLVAAAKGESWDAVTEDGMPADLTTFYGTFTAAGMLATSAREALFGEALAGSGAAGFFLAGAEPCAAARVSELRPGGVRDPLAAALPEGAAFPGPDRPGFCFNMFISFVKPK
ncbi:MAG: hypothetical protein NVSMB6_00990 [Burkholderiaceae bacterium]